MRFVIPFYYLFKSRLPRRSEKISWFLINLLPLFFLTYAVSNIIFQQNIVLFVLSIVVWQAIYEIGYIENDVFTIKREANPTIRLRGKEAICVERYFRSILLFRLIIAIVALIGIILLKQYWNLNLHILWFVAVLFLAQVAFIVHNCVRSRLNVITFAILSSSKYIALPLLMTSVEKIDVSIVAALTMFPLVRTIEHATKKKYRILWLKNLVKDLSCFRVIYYLLGSVFFFIVYLFLHMDNLLIILSLFIYFLIYRSTIFILIKINYIHSNIPQNY